MSKQGLIGLLARAQTPYPGRAEGCRNEDCHGCSQEYEKSCDMECEGEKA